MQEIDKGIYIENSYPGVTLGAVIYPQGVLMIDAPLRPEDARAWLSTLIHTGISPNRVMVNLDAHPDRTLGARSMECTIIAHQRTAQMFRGRPSVFKGLNMESGSEWETYDDVVGTRWAVPDITFNNQISLHWGSEEIVFESHPGPAPGSIWIILSSARVIFVGDAVLANQPPFIANADIPVWIEALNELLSSYREYVIVSGRGGVVTLDDVKFQRRHLKSILRGLERLEIRNASPESIESLIPRFISKLAFDSGLMEQFIQRYRHGLIQYYLRHYRPAGIIDG